MDSSNSELGDPSLASAFNSRYNGTLSQHQGIIYDSNSIQQSGSPVSQVYSGNCKPESGYWHQTSEYNVNAVSVALLVGVCVFISQLAFIVSGSIWSNDRVGRWKRLCGQRILATATGFVWSSIGRNWCTRMRELLNITICLLETSRWTSNVPSMLVYASISTENR